MIRINACALAVLLLVSIGLSDLRPFKVICYSGYRDGQGPGGGGEPSTAQVREDLQLIAGYTHGIRSYSCGPGGHEEKLPQLCDDIGIHLYMGVWISNQSDAANQQQVDNAIRLVAEGHPSIKAVIVGNEYLLRSDVNENIPRATSEAKLLGYINQVKAGVPANIVVTTAEPFWWWDFHSDALWNGVDEIFWHAHPYWDNFNINGAENLIKTQHTKAVERLARLGTPGKRDVCTETGWPTGTTRGASVGSPANQASFVRALHAYSWPVDFQYWFFSAFDEAWKNNSDEGNVGGQWGLWYANRTPKQSITQITQLIPENMQYEESHEGVKTIGRSKTSIIPLTYYFSGIYDVLGRKILKEKDFSEVLENRVLIPLAR